MISTICTDPRGPAREAAARRFIERHLRRTFDGVVSRPTRFRHSRISPAASGCCWRVDKLWPEAGLPKERATRVFRGGRRPSITTPSQRRGFNARSTFEGSETSRKLAASGRASDSFHQRRDRLRHHDPFNNALRPRSATRCATRSLRDALEWRIYRISARPDIRSDDVAVAYSDQVPNPIR